jgi:hypothetical protein
MGPKDIAFIMSQIFGTVILTLRSTLLSFFQIRLTITIVGWTTMGALKEVSRWLTNSARAIVISLCHIGGEM